MSITFVIPVYNERDTLEPLVQGITEHVGSREHTILFVDDGSTDGSSELLDDLKQRLDTVEVIRLRGNFGKSAALAAGFAHAEGDLVFTMDSDLQDEPKEIPRFIEKLDEGFDLVCGWKAVRHDPWHKTVPSRIYNGFVSWLFAVPLHDVNCGFKLFRRAVVKQIELYGEMHRLIPVMAHNLNYRVAEIAVEHHPRRYGQSKYGIERLSRGALDVLTMWFLTRYRHQPGHFFGKYGVLQGALGVLSVAVGVVLGLAGQSGAVSAALWAVGLVFCATGGLTICLGLMAELALRHFVHIDPAVYIEEQDR
ncbi:MAG: glycosyltransferase [Candidatus Hydrogenedentes bacterium]|nr:glycosyltransferase [Candidatus Hydrogenedentota bacterium]